MAAAGAGSRRSLVIAPQWIGDAVMAEPLLAALAARGEALTVAALPWVAPVFRAMPQVAEIVELPFAHGRLDGRARWRLGRSWRGRFDAAYVLPNSIKSALLPWLARVPLRIGYAGEGRPILLHRRLANPPGRPPMVGALPGAGQRRGRSGSDAPALADRSGHRGGGARRAAARRPLVLGLRAGRRVRPGQALAGRPLRRARQAAASTRRRADRVARLAGRSRAVRGDRRQRFRRSTGARNAGPAGSRRTRAAGTCSTRI